MTDEAVLLEHVAAFNAMLKICEKEEIDVITLFELEEGSVEHKFWLNYYTNFTQGRKTHRDATWMYCMSEEDLRYNRDVARRALSSCSASATQ